MEAVVVIGVEDGEEDEPARPADGEEYANTRQCGLGAGCVGGKATVVSAASVHDMKP